MLNIVYKTIEKTKVKKMREASFVKRNKKKWLLFENVLDKKEQVSPDKLSDLYIEITDDLSYAKTFYPQSNTAQYLNSVASNAYPLNSIELGPVISKTGCKAFTSSETLSSCTCPSSTHAPKVDIAAPPTIT